MRRRAVSDLHWIYGFPCTSSVFAWAGTMASQTQLAVQKPAGDAVRGKL